MACVVLSQRQGSRITSIQRPPVQVKTIYLTYALNTFQINTLSRLVGASDKAFLHRRGELVVKDEQTGELKPLEPMIDLLEHEIETLGDQLDEEKSRKPSNKSAIKKFVEEIKEKQNQIKSHLKRQQKLIDLNNLIIADTPQEGFFANLMSLMSQDSRRDQEYLLLTRQPPVEVNLLPIYSVECQSFFLLKL